MHGSFYCWSLYFLLFFRCGEDGFVFQTGNQQDGSARRKNLYGNGHGKAKGLRFANVEYCTVPLATRKYSTRNCISVKKRKEKGTRYKFYGIHVLTYIS